MPPKKVSLLKTWRPMIPLWGLAALLILLTGLYFHLLRPDIAGFLYDDGMYLMAAKALASGQGYRLMEIADSPWFYKYPPLYPLCLAGMWLANPHFPGNIIWLKSLNIGLLLLTFALLFYYFRRCLSLSPWISLGILALLGSNWHLIEVTIEMMSEPLFLLLTTLTLITIHPVAKNITPRRLGLLILLSVAAFYTRTMGLTLILAIGGWLNFKTSRKQALIYGASCIGLIAPWFLWTATKPNTTQSVGDFLVRSFQETYFQSLWMDLKYEYTLPEIVWGGIRELLGNASTQFFPLLERWQMAKPTAWAEIIILALSFTMVGLLAWQAYKAYKQKQITFSAVYIAVYLTVLPFWSFYQCYPRFLIVILPFLLVFWVQALQQTIQSKKRYGLAISLFFLAGLLSNVLHLQAYVAKPYANTLAINTKHDLWRDYEGIIEFLKKNTPTNAIIYTDNTDESYLYALHTSRKTLDQFLFLPKHQVNQACPTNTKACLLRLYERNAESTLQILVKNRVSYVVVNRMQITKTPVNSWHLRPKTTPTASLMLARHPDRFRLVAQTANGWMTVYQIQPNPLLNHPNQNFLQRASLSSKNQ